MTGCIRVFALFPYLFEFVPNANISISGLIKPRSENIVQIL